MTEEVVKKVKVIVSHGAYGCDTGCCGHWVELSDGQRVSSFHFEHPYNQDFHSWAVEFAKKIVTKEYGEDHVADLDWENSFVSDD